MDANAKRINAFTERARNLEIEIEKLQETARGLAAQSRSTSLDAINKRNELSRIQNELHALRTAPAEPARPKAKQPAGEK